MPHVMTCDRCDVSERNAELGTMNSVHGNLILVCPDCRAKEIARASDGIIIVIPATEVAAMKDRLRALEAALQELKECIEGDIEAPTELYDIPLRRAREALEGK